MILNSRAFTKTVDKLSRFKNTIGFIQGIDVLVDVLRNGKGKERLAAFDLIRKLVED